MGNLVALCRKEADFLKKYAGFEDETVKSGVLMGKAADKIERLREALSEIIWQKDCGCDGRNEEGEYVNFPDTERDAMYEIAKKALNND